jgi:hypothetical protein
MTSHRDRYGLFFLTAVEELMAQQQDDEERLVNEDDEIGSPVGDEESCGHLASDGEASVFSCHAFWHVDESTRELFARLATTEAAECLDAIDRPSTGAGNGVAETFCGSLTCS